MRAGPSIALVTGVALAAIGGISLIKLHSAHAVASVAPTEGCQDGDGDGYGLGCSAGPDCNDQDVTVHPGQAEKCNLRDDDCNSLVDDNPVCAPPAFGTQQVRIPAAALLMGTADNHGADDERPLHQVRISTFSIDRYEVTNARYLRCVNAGVCQSPLLTSSAKRAAYFAQPEFADYPVIFVDWDRANAFCRFDGGRLPTEAEWELAAKGPAPSQRIFPWGDAPPDCSKANMGGEQNCVGDTDRVGRRLLGASVYGVHDLAGNVWEWTADWYGPHYYAESPTIDPKGPASGTLKVMRGGCFASGASSLRVSCRKAELPGTWAPNVGFRCVRPEGA